MFKEKFIKAIHEKQKIRLTFYSNSDGQNLIRTCAPMDYGPSRQAKDKEDRYHCWDFDSDSGSHTLSLKAVQVKNIEIINETFNPADFVSWKTNWIISRDWGNFS